MNLFSKRDIRNILKRYNTQPSKRLGQNFLIDKGVVKKIIEAAKLHSKDIVLEIGPGIGTLTQELAKKAKKVIAIEKDPKMVEILKETLKDYKNIEIIQGDILKLNPIPYALKPYKLVANLPFYLTAPVIRKFLESKTLPKEIILVVQKEVAQRICPPRPTSGRVEAGAKPGKMSILAVSVQVYAEPKIISYVSKKSFWPQPKVDSAIIKIVPTKSKLQELGPCKLFFKIVKAGFSQPRKQLANNLAKELKSDKKKTERWLLKNNIQPSQRAETLDIKDWLKLFKSYKIL